MVKLVYDEKLDMVVITGADEVKQPEYRKGVQFKYTLHKKENMIETILTVYQVTTFYPAKPIG